MGNPVNPKTLSWTNPVQGTNAAGATVAYDAATDEAAIEIQFDGGATTTVPVAAGATSIDLTSLNVYQALAAGQHTVAISETTKEGAVSALSAPVTFLIAVVPLAPTDLVLA